MRKIYIPLLTCLLLAASACQSSDNAQEMLQDENERRQVYNTILEDEEMRNELMALMRDRNMGAGMMGSGGVIGDTAGMAQVHRQQMQLHMQQMMALCESDTAACQEMSRLMLQNQGMMTHMLQRMQQQGMIDTTCMQQLRRRMGR
jgi:hypothetical protein